MKRVLAMIVAAMIVSLSVMNTYKITAEAAGAGLIMNGLYETFNIIIGNYFGFGKSLDSVNSEFNQSNLDTIVNNELQGNSNTWNGVDISGITNKAKFIDFMTETLSKLQAYNAGTVPNSAYDALNERSYSATGTMATKTLEDEIAEGIETAVAMTDAGFKTSMEGTLNSIKTGESDLSAYDIGASYLLYKFLSAGLVANTSQVDTNWKSEVDNSNYLIRDLYKVPFVFNGVEYEIYKINSFMYYDTARAQYQKFTTNADTYMAVYKVGNGNDVFGIEFVFDSSFDAYYYTLNNSGVQTSKYKFEQYKLTNGIYRSYLNIAPVGGFPFKPINVTNTNFGTAQNQFYDYYNVQVKGKNPWIENAESVQTVSPELMIALESFLNKDITAEDFVTLANQISLLNSAGTEDAIADLTSQVAGLTITLPDIITDGKNDVVQAVDGLGEAILTLPRAIWLEFEATLDAIATSTTTATRPWEDGENKNNSLDITNIFSGIILLLLIVFVLLRIFLHCMIFIINVFRIPARPAFLPDEMVMGLEYLNTLEIPGIGLSVYAFMMGLIYILIMFYAIGVLRKSVDRIKLPKQ